MLLYDLTSTYVEGAAEKNPMVRLGYSRDHRPDCEQLVIALIVFGPRKLPELGKSLGQGLAHFRRASEDFKRQWEDEVAIERQKIESPDPPSYQSSHGSEPSQASAVAETSALEATSDVSNAPADTVGRHDEVAVESGVAAGPHTIEKEPVRDWF